MTYEETDKLAMDMVFRGRVKVAALKFASYIMDEASTVVAHNTRIRWASNCFMQPDIVTGQIVPVVVQDGQVQSDGANITDTALQTSVETTINKFMYT